MTNVSSYCGSPAQVWKNSLAILIAALSGIFSDAEELSADKKRPNILFILVDDQSPQDLEIYNPRSILQTPNIDRIARAGMILDNAHHMGAWIGGVCTPSDT